MLDWFNQLPTASSLLTLNIFIHTRIYIFINSFESGECLQAFKGIVGKQSSFPNTFSFISRGMSSGIGYRSSGSEKVRLNLEETELTLALPGESRGKSEILVKAGAKRSFSEIIDLNLGRSSSEKDGGFKIEEDDASSATKSPSTRTQAVGWPPVRASRQNAMKRKKLVKVAVDGAPYLRKVDLEMYKSYQQLLSALEDMFSCSAIRDYLNERKTMDPAIANGIEYVPTYEDKDGDWMLAGDVPWNMFVESCKKLRLMKSSEALGLESLNCTNSN